MAQARRSHNLWVRGWYRDRRNGRFVSKDFATRHAAVVRHEPGDEGDEGAPLAVLDAPVAKPDVPLQSDPACRVEPVVSGGDEGPGPNGPIEIEDGDHAVHMHIKASLGIAHAVQLHEAAVDLVNRGEPVIVNCEAAGHLHMSAVQILLLLKTELGGIGRDVEFVGVQPQVLRCLRAAGLEAALQN